jgi:hypothetical protein
VKANSKNGHEERVDMIYKHLNQEKEKEDRPVQTKRGATTHHSRGRESVYCELK